MSTDIRPDLPEVDDHRENGDLSVVELLHRLYALFYNKRFGLLIILAMAFLTLLGVLFTQAPDGVMGDPELRAQWLDSVRGKYRGWTDILAALGVFNVFSGVVFIVVTVLLALSITACTTHRFPLLRAQATKPHLHVRDSFFDHARVSASTTVPMDVNEASGALKEALHKQRYRTISDADGIPLYADRNRFAPFGTVVAHVAFVVILAGVLVTSMFGFRVDDLSVPVGSKVEVGHDTGLAVEARSFQDSYNPDGSPADYVSQLVLWHDGVPVKEQTVRVNAPLDWEGWTINQASFGIAGEIKVTNAAGAVVLDKAIPLHFQTSDRQYSYGKAEMPEQNLLVYVITPASGQVVDDIRAGEAQIEVYETTGEKPVYTSVLRPGQPQQGANLTWEFVRERQYTGLMMSKDPGAPIVWLGAALLAIGTCWTMFLRHHRLWFRLVPGQDGTTIKVGSPDRHDISFTRGVQNMVAGLGDTTSKE